MTLLVVLAALYALLVDGVLLLFVRTSILQLTQLSIVLRRAPYDPSTAPSAGCSPPFWRGQPSQPWDFGGLT